jgi:hypothetical protein
MMIVSRKEVLVPVADMDIRRGAQELEVLLSGAVDAQAVEDLRELLRDVNGAALLDFSRATALHDVLFSVLVDTVRASRCELRVRGLRDHHLRVLHYLHLELADDGALRPLQPGHYA